MNDYENAQQLSDKPFAYFDHPRTEMMAFLPEKGERFLEVGCAGGSFGKAVKDKYSAEVWGIELDPVAAKYAEERLDKVMVGTAESQVPQVPDNHFDCVTFNDVLEHLVDPYAMLDLVKTKLRPGGVLVASIPNIRHFDTLCNLVFKKQWRYEDAGILDRTHLRFFTQSSILDMFRDHQFEIEKMEGINRCDRKLERLVTLLTLGWSMDTRYLQFAVRARPKG